MSATHRPFEFATTLGISALREGNLERLVDCVVDGLPEGPMLYPPEIYTDQAEREIIAEMVREQLMLRTRKEIPYSVAVEIESMDEDAKEELG